MAQGNRNEERYFGKYPCSLVQSFGIARATASVITVGTWCCQLTDNKVVSDAFCKMLSRASGASGIVLAHCAVKLSQ